MDAATEEWTKIVLYDMKNVPQAHLAIYNVVSRIIHVTDYTVPPKLKGTAALNLTQVPDDFRCKQGCSRRPKPGQYVTVTVCLPRSAAGISALRKICWNTSGSCNWCSMGLEYIKARQAQRCWG